MRSPLAPMMARCLLTVSLSAGVPGIAAAADASGAAHGGSSDINGADVYSHICQGCHMSQGEGAVGAGHYPKLAGDLTLASWQYVALTVLQGSHGMPAFGTPESMAWEGPPGFGLVHLSDAQIADVINYVRSHFGNHYRDRVSASDVARLPHPVAAATP
jgi:mono/diheme cytochrome c family protein